MPRGTQKAIAALALAGGLSLPPMVHAGQSAFGMHDGMRGGGMRGMHGGGGRLSDRLDLTEEQQTAAKKLREDMRTQAEPLMDQVRKQMDELETLLDTAHPDATEVGNKVLAAHATREQLKALHDTFETRFSKLLNADQLAKFQQFQSMRKEWGGRHGFGFGPPPEGEE